MWSVPGNESSKRLGISEIPDTVLESGAEAPSEAEWEVEGSKPSAARTIADGHCSVQFAIRGLRWREKFRREGWCFGKSQESGTLR